MEAAVCELIFVRRQQPPLIMLLQFKHPVVEIDDAGTMTDTDVIDPQLLQAAVEVGLVRHIQGTGGLIKHGVAGPVDEQSGECQALLLP